MSTQGKKRLVIVGGGFAGLNIARKVNKDIWDVVVVDRFNYHSFPPLFYQVASSGLEPASICFPLRRELHSRKCEGCHFHMGEVRKIDTARKCVHTQYETLDYDALVIAAGTTNNFFGIPGLDQQVFTIKSTPEAIRCRNEVLDRLERASLCKDAVERASLLTFVVVGGGPAGVEIAGALGEAKRFILKREYPQIDPDQMRVVLVEGTDKLLRTMSEKSSQDAYKGLKQLLVEIELNKTMKSYENREMTFTDGTSIKTDTVIWTAGVTGIPFSIQGTEMQLARGARWEVDEFCKVKGVDDVYAVGDIAYMPTEKYPQGHPQVAQVALQMGKYLADVLSKPESQPKPFKYKDKGSMATIGRNRAVVDMGKIHMSGRLAWFSWLFIHLVTLLGIRNRAVVFINWMWSYCTFSSGLRLLLRPNRYPLRKYWTE